MLPTRAHEVPLEVPLFVFIQVGGVHGLAQKCMSTGSACAALMYGMSAFMSRAIEKLVSAVSPAVSSSE